MLTDYLTILVAGLPYVCWFNLQTGQPILIIPAQPGPAFGVDPAYASPARSYPVAAMPAAVQSLIRAAVDTASPCFTSL